MTEIEQKAREMLNEASGKWPAPYTDTMPRCNHYPLEALCRAIEQHEAFRREVSDACKKWTAANVNCREPHDLDRFIIPKPVDPLVEAMVECGFGDSSNAADDIRAAMKARGYEFMKIGEGA